MTIQLSTPHVDELGHVIAALRAWQSDEAPIQLHPGDVGWQWQFGPLATAAAIRTWRSDGHMVAVGFLDGPDTLRLTTSPQHQQDRDLAQQLVSDLTDPARGVLPAGEAAVESPPGALIGELLAEHGWSVGEAWTPLRLGLTEPVADSALRIEVTDAARVSVRTAVHRASFGSPKFTDERWQSMAAGLPYSDARCLVGYDDDDNPVAAATVWSAGPGKPGLLEPLGVSSEYRGHGYGTAISVAAAAALREMGSRSAMVCTPSANVGAVVTYLAAGFQQLPQRYDSARTAGPSSAGK